MPYEILEDGVTSDVTFRAWGLTLEEVFRAAADATLGVMVGALDSVRPLERRAASVEAEALDLLLVRFLDEIVFHKDAEGLLLRATDIHVTTIDGAWRAEATLRGEPIDPRRHELLADVKAVTLHGLRVERRNDEWEASATLDV